MIIPQPIYCKPAITVGKYGFIQEEYMNAVEHLVLNAFKQYSNDPATALKKARHIFCVSTNIERRYSCSLYRKY